MWCVVFAASAFKCRLFTLWMYHWIGTVSHLKTQTCVLDVWEVTNMHLLNVLFDRSNNFMQYLFPSYASETLFSRKMSQSSCTYTIHTYTRTSDISHLKYIKIFLFPTKWWLNKRDWLQLLWIICYISF